AHPAVRPGCSAAFAIDGEVEEKLVIVAEVEDPRRRPRDPAEVIKAIRRAVSETHDASAWDVVLLGPGEILKTSSGKIKRHACKAAYAGGDWNPVARLRPAGTETIQGPAAIERFLIGRLAEALEIRPDIIDPDEPFASYGLDSRTGVGLVGEL